MLNLSEQVIPINKSEFNNKIILIIHFAAFLSICFCGLAYLIKIIFIILLVINFICTQKAKLLRKIIHKNGTWIVEDKGTVSSFNEMQMILDLAILRKIKFVNNTLNPAKSQTLILFKDQVSLEHSKYINLMAKLEK